MRTLDEISSRAHDLRTGTSPFERQVRNICQLERAAEGISLGSADDYYSRSVRRQGLSLGDSSLPTGLVVSSTCGAGGGHIHYPGLTGEYMSASHRST